MPFARQALNAFLLAMSVGASSLGRADTPAKAAITDRVGVVYEITRDIESAGESNNASTSSSTDKDTLVERVLAVRNDGIELEYDLPRDATEQDRTSNWQFPVKVFKPFSGSAQLLNQPELEGRIASWLKKGGLTRAACGHWVFTWNAFKIDCDPQSALATVAAYDLGPNNLHDGLIYSDPQEVDPITLRKATGAAGTATYTGSTSVDPNHVRQEQAQSDVVVAEIMKKPLTLDDALRSRSNEKVVGTMSISFETDSSGFVRQRTTVTKLDITGADGVVEHRTTTETLSRRVISGG